MNPLFDKIESIVDALPLQAEEQCSYFRDKKSRSKVFKFKGDISPDFLELLFNKGFRRCGDIYYQHQCSNCKLCICCRILVREFKPTRSQKRVIARNRDIRFNVDSPNPTSVKEEIYLRYQFEQHHSKNGNPPTHDKVFNSDEQLQTMYCQMYTNPACTREIELYLNDALVGFGVLDVAVHTASAVYFVFDPRHGRRSLGTLAILHGIEWAQTNNRRFYHLGFYIPGHPKMEYKRKFSCAEFLDMDTGHWSSSLPERKIIVFRSS